MRSFLPCLACFVGRRPVRSAHCGPLALFPFHSQNLSLPHLSGSYPHLPPLLSALQGTVAWTKGKHAWRITRDVGNTQWLLVGMPFVSCYVSVLGSALRPASRIPAWPLPLPFVSVPWPRSGSGLASGTPFSIRAFSTRFAPSSPSCSLMLRCTRAQACRARRSTSRRRTTTPTSGPSPPVRAFPFAPAMFHAATEPLPAEPLLFSVHPRALSLPCSL